ncbi:HNH endonuclease [Vibrio parahaemolyticus]|uniref:HNH endonuclease n=1 Tax=Vibrio parahaemolyticus TaxID=670 RepID=UPI0003F8FC2C|nr:HNH endonuclease [Vibrio parahaemolyticus]EHY8552884.1 HNH endonuclease [Vibrio parahaemolyticus]EIA9327626.1 HNH endonuclease [Vibrio parahaemolyticus]
MEAKRIVCEAFISGKWYLIPVDALRNYKLNKEVLRRCPECKSKIKLMKESHDGNRAHFEHYKRNSNCSQSVSYGDHKKYGNNRHIYIRHSSSDINESKKHLSLLNLVLSRSDELVKSLDEDIAEVIHSSNTNTTEKQRLISSRLGQGQFRKSLLDYWKECAVTQAKNTSMLLASHIKPWSMSNDFERLDRFNGLLLSPNIDRAFDLGFISFDSNGRILFSPKLEDKQDFGLNDAMKIEIKHQHQYYLEFHREFVFKNT